MTSAILGLDVLLKKLTDIENLDRRATTPMAKSVDILYKDLAIPPPKARGAFSRMATPAQRRWYWAAVSSGRIQHSDTSGYIRTGRTRQSWKKRVVKYGGGIRGIVGTDRVPPTQYIQGSSQQPFHAASKYPTPQRAIEKSTPKIKAIWVAFMRKEI